MGRVATRGKKVTRSAADMANSRDTGVIRTLQYNALHQRVHEPAGPGDGMVKREVTIDLDRSPNVLLQDFGALFIDVLYVDLIAPSFTTSYRLRQLAETADDVSKGCKDESKKTFRNIRSRLKKAGDQQENQIYFGNTIEQQKFSLYDLILYFKTEVGLDFQGLLPSM